MTTKSRSSWDEKACVIAAEHGNLEILRWLRSQDAPCPWGDIHCVNTAREGKIEVLQWLQSQDPLCPCNMRYLRLVANH